MQPQIIDWHNLYRESWKGEIVPDAFVHPAKYSRALIRRIYEYLFEIGALHQGDSVIDPFGGVALGAEDAMRLGLTWTGCELEQKFVDLGTANIALWNARYRGRLPHWGTARLLQGDSRKLAEIIGATRQAAVSSPPYIESMNQHPSANDTVRRIERMSKAGIDVSRRVNVGGPNGVARQPQSYVDAAISAPPYADGCAHTGGDDPHPERTNGGVGSGHYHGVGLNGAIASPPYAHRPIEKNSGSIDLEKQYQTYRAQGGGASFESFCKTQEMHSQGYGESSGQLGAMKEGNINAVLSSPPYEGARIGQESGQEHCGHQDAYGASAGQLGETQGETFWSASRMIVEQVYQVLAPGGVAAWVVKDFVRNKERVPFCDQWRQLCEACGFETFAIARAWLVEDHGTQLAQDGNHKRIVKQRKSFFRRLAEKKGAPRIDYECVIVMRKPAPDTSKDWPTAAKKAVKKLAARRGKATGAGASAE